MPFFGQSRDSLKDHIFPSLRAQTDKLQRETQCAHQVQKNLFYLQITKTTKSQTKSFSLTLCNFKGFFEMRVLLTSGS